MRFPSSFFLHRFYFSRPALSRLSFSYPSLLRFSATMSEITHPTIKGTPPTHLYLLLL